MKKLAFALVLGLAAFAPQAPAASAGPPPPIHQCFRFPCWPTPRRAPAPAPLIHECFQAPCFPTPPR